MHKKGLERKQRLERYERINKNRRIQMNQKASEKIREHRGELDSPIPVEAKQRVGSLLPRFIANTLIYYLLPPLCQVSRRNGTAFSTRIAKIFATAK